MLNKNLRILLSTITVFLFIGCSKIEESNRSKDDAVITGYEDNVTKYKRKGLKGEPVTNIPPVNYEHSELTSEKFQQTQESSP